MKRKSSAKRKLKAVLVGCGRIAGGFDQDKKRNYVATHAGAYRQCRDTDLVAVCDADTAKLEAFAKTWDVPRVYTDFNRMLDQERPDLVSICTWPESHFKLAQTAIQKGVRGIFLEKPVTDRLEDADRLVELARRKKALIALNHSRRWDTGLNRVRAFLAAGKLGEVHQVQCFYTAGVSNTGTHLFDFLRDCLGDVESVAASPAPVFGDKDLTLSGELIFKNGVRASLNGLDVRDYLIFEIDFYGSLGRLRVTHSGFDAEYWKVGPSAYFTGYKELTPAKLNLGLDKKQMMVNAVQDIVSCVRTGRAPRSTAADGLKALEIICALRESYRRGVRVSLPLKNRKAGLGS